jgi:hypothetical protein
VQGSDSIACIARNGDAPSYTWVARIGEASPQKIWKCEFLIWIDPKKLLLKRKCGDDDDNTAYIISEQGVKWHGQVASEIIMLTAKRLHLLVVMK